VLLGNENLKVAENSFQNAKKQQENSF